ncbi:MAG: SAM-dependent chlorinase/fluorinase [Candidatus Zixiibacteriota bacterium]
MASIITITTDFGNADGYAGVMEGIIAGIHPAVRIVTISNHVPPGDFVGGNYMLKTHARYFPQGTVHLAVVDPGVGSDRNIIAIKTSQYLFVGPDNGLFSFIPDEDIDSIHTVTNPEYMLGAISKSFHGRDIMAPAAAYLSLGVDPACLGAKVDNFIRLTGIDPVISDGRITGRIIWIDRFGNLISNIEGHLIGEDRIISLNDREIGTLKETFSSVAQGQPLAYIGSGGNLEIAVRDGSARDFFYITHPADSQIQVA